jgi:hypothetical protein
MKTISAVILAVIISIISAVQVWAGSIGDSVEVRIISDSGSELPFYQVSARYPAKKVYAEAIKGDHYKLSVRNKLNRRVGVVIAVDGRNIVSGQKSWLKNNERMYILEPYSRYEYAGWRTGQDKINRFYFTEVPDSYAASFGDQSAMGVIAVAVYPEVQRYEPPVSLRSQASESAPASPSAGGERRKSAAAPAGKAEAMDRAAGTGYGRTEYSPSQTVAFDPESQSAENLYIKYEWRSTLCTKRIISCGRQYSRSYNRLWDNNGYAPPPPGRE